MREKKLLDGIETITASGIGICPFILMMTGSIKDSVFIGITGMLSFIIVSVIVSFLGKLFRKAEAAVLTLVIGGVIESVYGE